MEDHLASRLVRRRCARRGSDPGGCRCSHGRHHAVSFARSRLDRGGALGTRSGVRVGARVFARKKRRRAREKPTPARTTVRSGKDGAGAARAPETRGRAAFARSDIRAIEKSVPRVTDLVMSGAMRTPKRPGAGAAGAGAEATTAALASDAPSGATETPSEPPSPPTSRSPPLAAPETPAGVEPRRSARLSNASAQAAARDPGGSPPRPRAGTRIPPRDPALARAPHPDRASRVPPRRRGARDAVRPGRRPLPPRRGFRRREARLGRRRAEPARRPGARHGGAHHPVLANASARCAIWA